MTITQDFEDFIIADAIKDSKFRHALFSEAVEHIVSDELDIGRSLLRDYIKATIGFSELSKKTSIPDKSLMRMLSSKGNPQLNNLLSIISCLQKEEGIKFRVLTEPDEARIA